MTNPPDQNALNSRNSTAPVATRSETDAYLASIRKHRTSVGTGRLIFALDATASRRPTWEMACQLQAQMFEEVKTIGGLSVQLVYYRGLDECRASKWISRMAAIAARSRRTTPTGRGSAAPWRFVPPVG
jgi:hypothetical protein